VGVHHDRRHQGAGRVPELEAIAEWLAEWAETEYSWNHNLIALGDFNIDRKDDPLYQAFTSTGLTPAPGLDGLPRTIFDKPTTPHYYDQIAWFTADQKHRPILSLGFAKASNFDFVPQTQANMTLVQLSWHISDHRPLWAEFKVAQTTRSADGRGRPPRRTPRPLSKWSPIRESDTRWSPPLSSR
jgi:endonuclease/exonuclease/phosphatase family metal-dependent hydrolase